MHKNVYIRTETWLAAAAAIVIFIFYVLTIRDGHDWGGDFAQYIGHSLNIINGKPYSDIGYIINPNNPWISPSAYPPIFPLILAPILKLFGLDIYAIKVFLIGIFCLSLFILHSLSLGKIDSPVIRVSVVLFTGFSPWFWELKDQILSETPFIFFFLLFLLVAEKALQNDRNHLRNQVIHGLAIGMLGYLAYGCRTIGIILVPCYVIAHLFFRKKPSYTVAVACMVFLAMFLIQKDFLNSDAAYTRIMSYHEENQSTLKETSRHFSFLDPVVILNNVKNNVYYYMDIVSRHWDNEFSVVLRLFTIILTALLTFLGFYSLLFKRNVTEFTGFFYVALLLVVPFLQGNRYLLPIMPLYIMYIFKGLESSTVSRIPASVNTKFGVLATILFVSYVGAYTARDYTPLDYGIKTENTQDIFRYIQEHTAKDARIVFIKPRVLALFTGRKSFIYDTDYGVDITWKSIRKLGGDYALSVESNYLNDDNVFKETLQKYKQYLLPIYSNSEFKLYKILKKE